MIRKGTIDDVPQIVEMVGHFINHTQYATWLRFMPSAITELAERVIEIGVVFVAEADGRLVGLICGFPMIEPVGKQKILDELVWWVEPTYRGSRTVGPKLLRTFENYAAQKGCRFVKMVAPSGTDVGAYYARLGYAPVETSYIKRLDDHHGTTGAPRVRRQVAHAAPADP